VYNYPALVLITFCIKIFGSATFMFLRKNKMAARVRNLGFMYFIHVLSLISTLNLSSHARTELTIGFKTNIFTRMGQTYV
jgi:hypothetical protein